MDNHPISIDFLLYDGVNLLEVAGPAQVFTTANEVSGPRYKLSFLSGDGAPITTTCGLVLQVNGPALTKPSSHDLLVPGGRGVDAALASRQIGHAIEQWHAQTANERLIAVCSGALLVAACGLLDGRVATTHWCRQSQAKAQFPAVAWEEDSLFCIDGRYCSSAGVSAGIDLALELVRRDCGGATALAVARHLVMHVKRDGGQSQFSDLLVAQLANDTALEGLVTTLLQNPRANWTLEQMAEHAGLTPRTLSRRFQKEMSTTPHKFLERLRIKIASDVLSSGGSTGKAIEVSGFTDFQNMQRAFKRQLGTTVGTYRQRFGVAE